ncbi:MAG: 30S ribosomal protein S21 [Patescibacteria group bacterium]
MVEVRRKDNESVDNLIRRFTRKVQLSGIKYEVTKRQYKTRKPNKRQRQAAAQRRAELREKFDRLDKLGLLSDKYTRRGQSFRGR